MPRTIAIDIGSRSDLPQCADGLLVLHYAYEDDEIEIYKGEGVIGSIHGNPFEVIDYLKELSKAGVDVLITGAGWANQLTCVSDAILRALDDLHLVVIGVGFRDVDNERHTLAAELSMTEVPRTKVVCRSATDKNKVFIGEEGFKAACQYAVSGDLPTIEKPKARLFERMPFKEMVMVANGWASWPFGPPS